MIKIHNQAACEQAMNAAWNEERADIGDQCPVEVQIMFSRGFRYAYMIVELKEAEIDLMNAGVEFGCDVDGIGEDESLNCVWDNEKPEDCDIAKSGITKDKCKHWRKFNIKEQILCGMIEID